MTTEKILSELLSQAPEGIDTRPGSIFYDAVKGCAIVMSRLYADINMVANLVYIDTTGGEYLDKKASEHGLSRHTATQAVYKFIYNGTAPSIGSRFYCDGLYFTLELDVENNLCLIADKPGEASNSIIQGTPAVPVIPVSGLITSSFGEKLIYGTEIETDESLRERLRQRISAPAENGNKAHYKKWCEEVDGVGLAKIVPLWNGANTVKGVLISPSGTSVSTTVVNAVQNYVDPNSSGLGEGAANLGAHFTAVSASEYQINVKLSGFIPANGFTTAEAIIGIKNALTDYLKKQALTAFEETTTRIYSSALGAVILSLPSVNAYSTLTINSSTEPYVTISDDKVAVMGTVTTSA